MLTVAFLLAVSAFVVTIVAAMGRAPLWIAVLLLSVLHLVTGLPLGR